MPKHKAIFFHIPKTAGTSIVTWLGESVSGIRSTGHNTPEEVIRAQKISLDLVEEYWKFGFIRDPWAKLVSNWTFRVRLGPKKGARYMLADNFTDHIREIATTDWQNILRHDVALKKQIHYIRCLENPKLNLDFVGKFEDLQADLKKITDHLEIPFPELEHRNISADVNKHYSAYYTKETRDMVAEVYAEDIEYGNYSFDYF